MQEKYFLIPLFFLWHKAIQNNDSWENVAKNALIKLEQELSKNMKYTYGTMAGIVQVLDIGDMSNVFDESAGFRKKITAIKRKAVIIQLIIIMLR